MTEVNSVNQTRSSFSFHRLILAMFILLRTPSVRATPGHLPRGGWHGGMPPRPT
jgi:hypothetical protein